MNIHFDLNSKRATVVIDGDSWLVIAKWTYSANKPLEHYGIKVEGYGDFMS